MNKKSLIGNGVNSFFNQENNASTPEGDSLVELDVDLIIENEFQPRTAFDDDKILELSHSIKENGILQPLTVIINKEGKYELIAGERRLRASRLAGLEKVPVIIKNNVTSENRSLLAILENLQREDLNCVELAVSYKKTMSDFKLSQEQLSQKLGVARASIANSLRILNLPEKVLGYLEKGKISLGHGKILAGLKSTEQCISLAEKVVYGELSVKKLSELLKKDSLKNQPTNESISNIKYKEQQKELIMSTGLAFEIKDKKDAGGKIVLHFSNDEELKKILESFSK